MKDLKLIIRGQILSTLSTLYPAKNVMTEEELSDYEDLKRCAEILKPNEA